MEIYKKEIMMRKIMYKVAPDKMSLIVTSIRPNQNHRLKKLPRKKR